MKRTLRESLVDCDMALLRALAEMRGAVLTSNRRPTAADELEALLRANPDPSLDQIRTGVSGNLCRCGAYQHIFRAASRAAELKREGR